MASALQQVQDKNKIFSVSEFNQFIGSYLSSIGEVVVEGEISQIEVSQGKWLFLTIKDESASVRVFGLVFRIKNYHLLEPGMLVHVYGSPRLYQKTGQFSLWAEEIVPAGEGALQLAFEKLKLKLEKEGLFDSERKRPLPAFPEKIGLITAKNSQAYSDFIKVLNERMGGIKIYFYPVQVQGRDSVNSILAAFEYFNKNLKDLDLLALTRGGGSLEDLLSFNDEQIARAVFSSKIPVVCGVGHEDNISLADLAADLRASTPSNAAELIVRDRKEVLRHVSGSVALIYTTLKSSLSEKGKSLSWSASRLNQSLSFQLEKWQRLITRFARGYELLKIKADQLLTEVEGQESQLTKIVVNWLNLSQQKLESLARLLKSLDYQQVLKRGFSITMDEKGAVLKEVGKIQKDKTIKSLLFNGKIFSKVLKTET